jgi:hypothetical protein
MGAGVSRVGGVALVRPGPPYASRALRDPANEGIPPGELREPVEVARDSGQRGGHDGLVKTRQAIMT